MSKCRSNVAKLPLLFGLLCGGISCLVAQTQQKPAPEQQMPASGLQPLSLTEQVVRDVLEPLQRGIEEHNRAQALAVFDSEDTPDYAMLRDQMRAFFSQYETIRFRYKVLQVTSEKDHGFAIAEVDMAATPADQTGMAVHRSTQMNLQLKLSPEGWKVVGLKPADFFTQ